MAAVSKVSPSAVVHVINVMPPLSLREAGEHWLRTGGASVSALATILWAAEACHGAGTFRVDGAAAGDLVVFRAASSAYPRLRRLRRRIEERGWPEGDRWVGMAERMAADERLALARSTMAFAYGTIEDGPTQVGHHLVVRVGVPKVPLRRVALHEGFEGFEWPDRWLWSKTLIGPQAEGLLADMRLRWFATPVGSDKQA